MAKIKIFPKEAIKIKIGNEYVDYETATGGNPNGYDIGDRTSVDIQAAYSKYCSGSGECEYNVYNTAMTTEQRDAMYRVYDVTYVDDNGCESTDTFNLSSKTYTRPIDDVTSSMPKEIRKHGSSGPVTGTAWWTSTPSSTITTYYYDSDSAFATVTGDTCQGICNGFELSTSVFTEFYSGTTNIAEAGSKGANIPWSSIQWEKVPDINDWWCHPISLDKNTLGSDHRVDITGGTNGCWGLKYDNNPDWGCMPNRRSGIFYGSDNYTGNVQYRVGKFVIKLPVSVDAFTSLGGVWQSCEQASINANSCSIQSYNDETFTAVTSGGTTFSGETVHFMSPVEVYVFQKTSNSGTTPEYLYTVRSDVTGATVSWSGATPVTNTRALGGTNTINGNGYAQATNTTNGIVYVHIEKEGYTFVNNGYGTLANSSDNVTINKTDTPTPPAGCCDSLQINLPVVSYTYTVNSNVDGATVTFYNGSTYLTSKTISNGSCSATLDYSSIKAEISKSGCSFSPATTNMTNGGSATMNGTCGSSSSCSNGGTGGLSSSSGVSATITSKTFNIGTWTKSPEGCTDVWAYNSSKPLSAGTLTEVTDTNVSPDSNKAFIDVNTITFDGSGTSGDILGKVRAENTTSAVRVLYIPTILGTKTDFFRAYQNAASTPTVSCNTCNQVSITKLTGIAISAAASSNKKVATFEASCEPTNGFSAAHSSGSQFLSNISVGSSGNYKYYITANSSANSGSGNRSETLSVGFINNSGQYITCSTVSITQEAQCYNVSCPSPSQSTISHTIGTSETYPIAFNSSCWSITSTDESNPDIMTASVNGNTVNVTCVGGTNGQQATVTVNLTRTDGTTCTKTITANFVGSIYTYTVYGTGDADGTSVYWWYNGSNFATTTISNGKTQITRTDGVNVGIVAIKQSGGNNCNVDYGGVTSISPNGSSTINVTCSVVTACSYGTITPLSTCITSAATTSDVQIGSWSKTPSDCSDLWQVNTTDTGFLYSIRFDSNGKIYAKVNATNTGSSTRSVTIPLKLGSYTSSLVVTQCAGSTPTSYYSYTVTSTNSAAEGATVGFFNNGSLLGSGTISNKSCTYTTSTYYASLTASIMKSGCSDKHVTVNANSTTNFTLSCGTPCSTGYTTTISSPLSADLQVGQRGVIGYWTKDPSNCTDNWQVDESRQITWSNGVFLNNITFESDGNIWATITSVNNTGSSRWCEIPLKLGLITSAIGKIWQLPVSTPCSENNVQHSISASSFNSCGYRAQIGTYTYTCDNFDLSKLVCSISSSAGNNRYTASFSSGKVYLEGLPNTSGGNITIDLYFRYNNVLISPIAHLTQASLSTPYITPANPTISENGGTVTIGAVFNTSCMYIKGINFISGNAGACNVTYSGSNITINSPAGADAGDTATYEVSFGVQGSTDVLTARFKVTFI